jgi:hypothetical protein
LHGSNPIVVDLGNFHIERRFEGYHQLDRVFWDRMLGTYRKPDQEPDVEAAAPP